jgi:hypothetical protein
MSQVRVLAGPRANSPLIGISVCCRVNDHERTQAGIRQPTPPQPADVRPEGVERIPTKTRAKAQRRTGDEGRSWSPPPSLVAREPPPRTGTGSNGVVGQRRSTPGVKDPVLLNFAAPLEQALVPQLREHARSSASSSLKSEPPQFGQRQAPVLLGKVIEHARWHQAQGSDCRLHDPPARHTGSSASPSSTGLCNRSTTQRRRSRRQHPDTPAVPS